MRLSSRTGRISANASFNADNTIPVTFMVFDAAWLDQDREPAYWRRDQEVESLRVPWSAVRL
jgi:hypothetical protein